MAAAQHDLVIEQGASYSQAVQWKVGSPATAVNLTGYTARMQLRSNVTASTTALSLTTENGRIALTTGSGAGAGTITLSISATDTAALTAGRYVYDLELVSSGGQVTRLMEGIVTVSAEVTR